MTDINAILDAIAPVLESIVDSKIEKALNRKNSSTSVLAKYAGTDSNGKQWVVYDGTDVKAPISWSTIEAAEGDRVSVTISNGRAVMDNNLSNPSAGVIGVEKAAMTAEEAKNDAVTAIQYSQQAYMAAIDAQTSAESASTSAAAAAIAADDAQITANAVHGLAEQAQTDADAAKTASSDAVQAAEDADIAATAAQNGLKSIVQGATTVEKAVSVMQTALEAVVDYDPQEDTVTEYFWHDANGAHVLGDESGYRNDVTSSGSEIVEVSTESSVAKFGADSARIGPSDSRHSEVTKSRFGFYDLDGNPIFHAGTRDAEATSIVVFRGVTAERKAEIIAQNPNLASMPQTTVAGGTDSSTATVDGYATVTDAYAYLYNDSMSLWVQRYIGAENVTVVQTHSEVVYHAESSLTFTWPTAGCEFAVIYYDREDYYSFLAFGDSEFFEDRFATLGGFSTSLGLSAATGYVSIAGGIYSSASGAGALAYGYNVYASGAQSTALGLGTKASSASQLAMGRYNAIDSNGTYAAIIGNGTGTAQNARSNALTVDWSGNVGIAGDVKDLSGNAKYLPLSGGTMTGDIKSLYGVLSRFLTVIDSSGVSKGRFTADSNYLYFGAFDANGDYAIQYRMPVTAQSVSPVIQFRNYENGAWGSWTSWIYSSQASRTANTVLAAPNGSAGAATFRALVPADCSWLGDRKVDDQSGNVSVANSTWVAIVSVELTAGVWILNGNVSFASNATGRRYACIHSASPTTAAQRQCATVANAVNGAWTILNLAGSKAPSSKTTYTLYAYQTSGSTLNCTGYLAATRIK